MMVTLGVQYDLVDSRADYEHINPDVAVDFENKIDYRKFDRNNWSEPTRINDVGDSVAFLSIAVDSKDNVHIAWDDKRDENSEI